MQFKYLLFIFLLSFSFNKTHAIISVAKVVLKTVKVNKSNKRIQKVRKAPDGRTVDKHRNYGKSAKGAHDGRTVGKHRNYGKLAEGAHVPNKLAEPGEDLFVGIYNQVRRGNIKSGLNPTHTPHHAVQDAVSTTTHGRGVTINMSKTLHEKIRTYRKPVEQGLDARTHLAKDVKDLRGIFRDAGYDRFTVNRQLQELIRQNKSVMGQ